MSSSYFDAGSRGATRVLRPVRRGGLRFYFWLIFLLVVLPGLGLIADRGFMSWRLGREIAARRGRGELLLARDFARPAIADDVNAAIPLLRAGGAVRFNLDEERCLDEIMYCRCLAPTALDLEAVSKIIRAREGVFRAVAEARERSGIDWDIAPHILGRRADNDYVNELRMVGCVLSYGAWLDHHEGDDARAMQDVRDLIYLSRMTGVAGAPWVAHCTALGSWWAAAARVREMALTLRVGEGELSKGMISRRQVVEMIATLLDESSPRAAVNLRWQARRREALESSMDAANRPWAINADCDRCSIDLLAGFDRVREAMVLPNYPLAAGRMASLERHERVGIFVDFNPFFSGQENLLPEYKVLTERRVAAIGLALRLFALDHEGRLPAKLEELVPAYLPAVPADPFAADGRKLGYRSGPVAVVYSVGLDGVDDGMDDRPLKSGYDEWDARDAVFYLAVDPLRKERVYVPPTRGRPFVVAPSK